jgi:hypothetical protein
MRPGDVFLEFSIRDSGCNCAVFVVIETGNIPLGIQSKLRVEEDYAQLPSAVARQRTILQ